MWNLKQKGINNIYIVVVSLVTFENKKNKNV